LDDLADRRVQVGAQGARLPDGRQHKRRGTVWPDSGGTDYTMIRIIRTRHKVKLGPISCCVSSRQKSTCIEDISDINQWPHVNTWMDGHMYPVWVPGGFVPIPGY
jgi:hypothetical protein